MKPAEINSQQLWDKLPRWQSHKIVRADMIVGISRTGVNYEGIPDGDSGWRWLLEGGGTVIVCNALADRDAPRLPSEGDFYVVYEGGYESWSPAKPFLEGNTPL